MGRKRTTFEESLQNNHNSYWGYMKRLTELSVSMFEWKNLPSTIDVRFLELSLFSQGQAVFFKDDVLGYLGLKVIVNGSFNVYGVPIKRRAYAYNNYQKELDDSNSVIIYNNYLRTNSVNDVYEFSRRLYNLDRIIDINANAQKTPVLVQGSEQQMLTLKNVYMKWDGNQPVIYGDKNLDINSLRVLKTDAPYVADKIYQLKTQIWNEALTYLGISNLNIQKKERLITDEVTRNQGGTIASRYSRLMARREAVEQINKMFGLNIEVNYREDYRDIADDVDTTNYGGEFNE